jgi:hypothetical protein
MLEQHIEGLKTDMVNYLVDETKTGLLKWKKTPIHHGGCFYTLGLNSCTITLSRLPSGSYRIGFSDDMLGTIGTAEDARELWDFLQTKEKLDNLSNVYTKLEKVWEWLQYRE